MGLHYKMADGPVGKRVSSTVHFNWTYGPLQRRRPDRWCETLVDYSVFCHLGDLSLFTSTLLDRSSIRDSFGKGSEYGAVIRFRPTARLQDFSVPTMLLRYLGSGDNPSVTPVDGGDGRCGTCTTVH